MRRQELKALTEISNALHDHMPFLDDECGCRNPDGNMASAPCEFHGAIQRLYRLIERAKAEGRAHD